MENIYTFLQHVYLGTVYQISAESPEFCRRYYKKHFGLYFIGHVLYGAKKIKTYTPFYSMEDIDDSDDDQSTISFFLSFRCHLLLRKLVCFPASLYNLMILVFLCLSQHVRAIARILVQERVENYEAETGEVQRAEVLRPERGGVGLSLIHI